MKEEAQGNTDFQDVADFGNQELGSLASGVLVYDLKISGIDTIELRENLKECLSDKRLNISVETAMAGIKTGELNLNNLNPVVTSVIVSRLKHLPLAIKWTSQQLIKGTGVLTLVWFLIFGFLAFPSAFASEWARHEVNLKGYAIKIVKAQDELAELIHGKNENKDQDEREALIKEINKKYADLKSVFKDYKAEVEHVRFEHPEQGDTSENKYRHLKIKSLKELEKESGIDGQLTRLKRKAENIYPSKVINESKPVPKSTPIPVVVEKRENH